jgi:hypothetical protein
LSGNKDWFIFWLKEELIGSSKLYPRHLIINQILLFHSNVVMESYKILWNYLNIAKKKKGRKNYCTLWIFFFSYNCIYIFFLWNLLKLTQLSKKNNVIERLRCVRVNYQWSYHNVIMLCITWRDLQTESLQPSSVIIIPLIPAAP